MGTEAAIEGRLHLLRRHHVTDGPSQAMIEEASRLGKPFLVFTVATEFRLEVEAHSVP